MFFLSEAEKAELTANPQAFAVRVERSFGALVDKKMASEVSITVLATGFNIGINELMGAPEADGGKDDPPFPVSAHKATSLAPTHNNPQSRVRPDGLCILHQGRKSSDPAPTGRRAPRPSRGGGVPGFLRR